MSTDRDVIASLKSELDIIRMHLRDLSERTTHIPIRFAKPGAGAREIFVKITGRCEIDNPGIGSSDLSAVYDATREFTGHHEVWQSDVSTKFLASEGNGIVCPNFNNIPFERSPFRCWIIKIPDEIAGSATLTNCPSSDSSATVGWKYVIRDVGLTNEPPGGRAQQIC